jgi:hypothetical protein
VCSSDLMPGHCSEYFDVAQATRRLSCLRLTRPGDLAASERLVVRLGPTALEGAQRLICTCAPVVDYTGREVARVGLFGHGPDEGPIVKEHNRGAWELARLISMRLGFLSTPAFDVPA